MENEKKLTVLVVDDTKSNIDILVGLLDIEYDIRVAINGKGALEAVAKSPPDIILLDILMPEMDGYTLAKHIRNDSRLAGIKILMHSSLSNESTMKLSSSVGADMHVSKLDPPKLADAIIQLLDIKDIRRIA